MGTDEEIILGGGSSGYGLRLDLEVGWSQHCDTFHVCTLHCKPNVTRMNLSLQPMAPSS